MSSRIRRIVCGVVVTGSAFVLGAGGGAQTDKPAAGQPQLLMATIVTLKPGMGAEYVALQTKEVMPAQQKGGGLGREAFSGGVFGGGDMFAFFSPVQSMAQFDGPSPVVKALGQEGAAALNAKTAPMIASRRTMLVRVRPDLSIPGDPKFFYQLFSYSVRFVTGSDLHVRQFSMVTPVICADLLAAVLCMRNRNPNVS